MPSTLHGFHNRFGAHPDTALIQVVNGEFYGTTPYGGAHDMGTVFRITPGGAFNVVYSFDTTDGRYPVALILG